MECSWVLEHLSEYLEGELPLQEREQVEAHLQSCPSCVAERDELAALLNALGELPPAELPVGFHEALMERLRREANKKREGIEPEATKPVLMVRPGGKRQVTGRFASLAAGVLLLVAVGFGGLSVYSFQRGPGRAGTAVKYAAEPEEALAEPETAGQAPLRMMAAPPEERSANTAEPGNAEEKMADAAGIETEEEAPEEAPEAILFYAGDGTTAGEDKNEAGETEQALVDDRALAASDAEAEDAKDEGLAKEALDEAAGDGLVAGGASEADTTPTPRGMSRKGPVFLILALLCAALSGGLLWAKRKANR